MARDLFQLVAYEEPDPFDPFSGVRRWLDDECPSDSFSDISNPFLLAKSPPKSDVIRKHDELTAIPPVGGG